MHRDEYTEGRVGLTFALEGPAGKRVAGYAFKAEPPGEVPAEVMQARFTRGVGIRLMRGHGQALNRTELQHEQSP